MRLYVDQKEVSATLTQLRLLQKLFSNPDRAFSRDQLIDLVWGIDVFIQESTVSSTIKATRRLLGKYKNCIETIYGHGYRFNPNICKVEVLSGAK